ncbi:MAG: alpha/beta fold hydrolase [Gammaproteobacteria bacterium]|jgi:pimeloyl-ACP methyl ester carboxylesterase|nr:alpha/beta fold hydrolase [Gammaproteobacteria bacterium]
MIHGWALDHRIFDAQVAGLRNDLLVLRYDRRGFGRSDAPPDLAREVDDIDALLDAMGLESAHVLGMSQGGRIALRYAVTRPARVRSLILQGAAVDGFNADEDESERIPVQEYADLAKRGNLHEVRHRWLRHPMMRLDARFSNEAILLRKIVDGYFGRDLLSFEPGGYAYPIDVSSALPRFHRPVLLITGATESVNRKRHAAELLSRLPDCREVVLEDGGHLCNLTAANDYNNAVREFCRTVESHSG